MQLKSIVIHKNESWHQAPDAYTGEITFCGAGGEIKLTMVPEISSEILRVCQKQLIKSASELANGMTNIIEQSLAPMLASSQGGQNVTGAS